MFLFVLVFVPVFVFVFAFLFVSWSVFVFDFVFVFVFACSSLSSSCCCSSFATTLNLFLTFFSYHSLVTNFIWARICSVISTNQKNLFVKSACDEIYCYNGETCQSGFTVKRYRCLCPSGFKGKRCQKGGSLQYIKCCFIFITVCSKFIINWEETNVSLQMIEKICLYCFLQT